MADRVGRRSNTHLAGTMDSERPSSSPPSCCHGPAALCGPQKAHQLKHWLIDEIRMRTLETRMPRRRGPLQHFLGKFFHTHAAMRRRYDREQTRVLRRHRLYPIKCEGKLEIERLFAPQRAI